MVGKMWLYVWWVIRQSLGMNLKCAAWLLILFCMGVARAEDFSDLAGRVKAEHTHKFGDYFSESLGIIERLDGLIKADLKAGLAVDNPEMVRQRAELEMLVAALNEELELAASNRRLFAAPKILNVRDFGAKGDDSANNFKAVKLALEEVRRFGAGVRLVFPSGRYRIKPPGTNPHIALNKLRDLVIEGQPDTWIIMEGIGPCFSVQGSRNIAIRNFKVDADPLPFCQGIICGVDQKGVSVDMRLQEGYPSPDNPLFMKARYYRGTARNPKTGIIHRECGDPRIKDVKHIGNGVYRLFLMDNARKVVPALVANMKNGMLFIANARQIPGSGNALQSNASEYILYENLDIHASWGHAFLSTACKGMKVLGGSFEPLPGSGRFACNVADGFHLSRQFKGPYIENHRIRFVNDDCFNSYAKWHVLAREDAPDAYTLAPGTRKDDYRSGDHVVIMDTTTGKTAALATVREIEKTQWQGRNAIRLRFDQAVGGFPTRDTVGKGLIKEREHLKNSGAQPPFAFFICNLGMKGDGYVLRNCDWGYNRASGMKLKAPNGVVRNMQLTRHYGAAASLKVALDWREGFYPHNLLMQDNTIRNHIGIGQTISLPGGAHIKPTGMYKGVVLINNKVRPEPNK